MVVASSEIMRERRSTTAQLNRGMPTGQMADDIVRGLILTTSDVPLPVKSLFAFNGAGLFTATIGTVMDHCPVRTEDLLSKTKVAGGERVLVDVLQRDGVVCVDSEHGIGSDLCGVRHGSGKIRKQRMIELQRVLAGRKIVDLVLTRAGANRERGVARIAEQR